MIKVLSIAGSDPSSGAGIQLDLKIFQKLGAFGMAIPAALTVQNSRGVAATEPVPASLLAQQTEALLADIKPKAVKTGMLLTSRNVDAVAKVLSKYKIRNVIVDPVFRSSSGKTLLERDAVLSLKTRLFPQALVITPNIPEAEALTGLSIRTEADMDSAAGNLLDFGPSYVLIKGGHRIGPASDTLYGGKSVLTFSTRRRKGEFHGTGCALSSALTVFIARGLSVEKAVEKAKQVVDSLLKSAAVEGKGKTKYFQL
jgi:hydroxymethylpyrimidine kinase/phosphomethylpyrimidine kinase